MMQRGIKPEVIFLPKCIVKNYNIIINWKKTGYDQPVDSDIKW